MIEYIVLAITVIVFIIASIEDIKKREVYDFLNYGYLISILVIGLVHSFIVQDFTIVSYAIFGMIIGFIFGSIFYYLGFWGGGDAKFLLGFGAASFYLIEFTKNFLNIFTLLETGIKQVILSNQISQTILLLIFILNIIFIGLILIRMLFKKNKKELIDLLSLLFSLSFLTLANFVNVNNNLLIVIGLISFIFILLSDDKIFRTVYFSKKTSIDKIKEGDSIEIGKDKFYEEVSRGEIDKIKESKSNIKKRIIVPYFLIIMINLIIFVSKIMFSNSKNLEIIFFVIKFLMLSFLAGGIIAILILLYTYIKNFKKIDIKIPLYQRLISYLALVFVIVSLFTFQQVTILFLLLAILPYFFAITKESEKFMFVAQKPISQLVPGDWIVEDFKIKNKTIFSINDFKLGVNENQIKKIIELSKKNNIKTIKVKDGIAFLPPMFIGFLILLFI